MKNQFNFEFTIQEIEYKTIPTFSEDNLPKFFYFSDSFYKFLIYFKKEIWFVQFTEDFKNYEVSKLPF